MLELKQVDFLFGIAKEKLSVKCRSHVSIVSANKGMMGADFSLSETSIKENKWKSIQGFWQSIYEYSFYAREIPSFFL